MYAPLLKFLDYHFFANIYAFFVSNTFISNTRLKFAKNQANANPEAEFLLLYFHEIIHILHRRYHPKITGLLKICNRANVSVFMRLYD